MLDKYYSYYKTDFEKKKICIYTVRFDVIKHNNNQNIKIKIAVIVIIIMTSIVVITKSNTNTYANNTTSTDDSKYNDSKYDNLIITGHNINPNSSNRQ